MEISPVRLEDDAVFQCQVGAVEGVLGIRSRSARFTVQVPPEPPVIIVTHAHSHAQVYKSSSSLSSDDSSSSSSTSLTVSSSSSESSTTDDQQKLSSNNDGNDHILRTTAGMTIELTCEAHGGRPPAEVSVSQYFFHSFIHSFNDFCFLRKQKKTNQKILEHNSVCSITQLPEQKIDSLEKSSSKLFPFLSDRIKIQSMPPST